MPASDAQRYAARLNAVAVRYGKLEDGTARAIWQLLKQVQSELADSLTGAEGFRQYQLRQVQAQVDAYLQRFDAQATAALRQGMQDAWQYGGAAVVEPLQAIGVTGAFLAPTPATLNVVVDGSADLVRGITEEARRFINLQIRQAALQQITPVNAMQAIGRKFGLLNLRPGHETVKGIAYNAERIVRTELGRTFNLANHSQQLATAERVPELLKKWVATGDSRTRRSHLAAHMRYADNPIPVSEPFQVGGALLMYPLDPAGPPEETINCRCRSVPVHPRVGVLPLRTDDRIRGELERRKGQAQEAAALILQCTPARLHLITEALLAQRIHELDAALRITA